LDIVLFEKSGGDKGVAPVVATATDEHNPVAGIGVFSNDAGEGVAA
jgi:hypothetical protein